MCCLVADAEVIFQSREHMDSMIVYLTCAKISPSSVQETCNHCLQVVLTLSICVQISFQIVASALNQPVPLSWRELFANADVNKTTAREQHRKDGTAWADAPP